MKNIPNFKKISFVEKLENNINRKVEVGLRINGHIKKGLEGNPLITIITVVRNKSDVIEETIQGAINTNMITNTDEIVSIYLLPSTS